MPMRGGKIPSGKGRSGWPRGWARGRKVDGREELRPEFSGLCVKGVTAKNGRKQSSWEHKRKVEGEIGTSPPPLTHPPTHSPTHPLTLTP